jgi:hypothetical protein
MLSLKNITISSLLTLTLALVVLFLPVISTYAHGNRWGNDNRSWDNRPEKNKILITKLTGENEVPGPGDEDGKGWSFLWFRPTEDQICYSILTQNLDLPATGAHIHAGSWDEAGPVVVELNEPNEAGTSSGCATVDESSIQDIRENLHDYYVNIHTEEFPDGAIRGQLSE